jgi:hypothetical protein
MHTDYLGDSYDIVKRFFCEALRRLGYMVHIDPMFTGEWAGQETIFYRFLGVEPCSPTATPCTSKVLFLDPDTGVNKKGGLWHVSYERVVSEAKKHEIVFVFDQGFSRGRAPKPQMQEKLAAIASLGGSSFYYDSHARFLFVSRERASLEKLRSELLSQGLPSSRFVEVATNPEADKRE